MSPPASAAASPPILTRLLCRWVALCQRHAGATAVSALLATVAFGTYAATHFGFNADPNALFRKDLRFQQMIAAFSHYFPVLTDSLLIVVDGSTPEKTRAAQEDLASALAKRADLFHRVFLPGEEPFFERSGLLYGSVEDVEDFADRMTLLQPLIGELSADPSLPTLSRVIQLGLEESELADIDAEQWQQVLEFFGTATLAAVDDRPVDVSWEAVLLADSGFEPTTLRVIVADPVLEVGRVLAAEASIEAVREEVRALGLAEDGGVRVRVTGYPALNYEEMKGLAGDTGIAGSLSFALVVIVLVRALRSRRAVLAAAITLIAGVVWSAAFAAATVGELNPISITFGVLVIGLGVDFLIHLGMHITEAIHDGRSLADATQVAVRDTGLALVLCAATTIAGFLAFVPTEYRGVSDLGLAASGGMAAMLFLTVTLLPALLDLLLSESSVARIRATAPPRALPLHVLRPVPVCIVAGALAVGAFWLLPRVDLDTNVIRMRNPDTPSVQAFSDLLASRTATPWFLDALAPSLAEADRLAEKMRALEEVDRAFTLSDFVPEQQEEKLAVLADVAMILDMPPVAESPPATETEKIAALTELSEFLAAAPALQGESPLARSALRLREALEALIGRVRSGDRSALAKLEHLLLDPLPAQLDRLDESLEVGRIERSDLPPGLVSRMLAADGHARIQVYPAGDLWHNDEMIEFVEAIRPIWPDITGLPVNLVESARATWRSLSFAILWAAIAITALLLALWRRIGDTFFALAPLLIAVALTQVSTEFVPVSFNFANVIVLPLILGIGIDSAVHLVYRERELGSTNDLFATTTARAVLYSAVTTTASFGTLAISGHRGVASLGYLLVIGMMWTLAANLILLPALMTLRAHVRRSRRNGA